MVKLRKPYALSPSGLAKFENERTVFFERYLCPVRVARPPQEPFMAVGSGFDAFVKSAIHTAIYGEETTKGGQFEFGTIFESQVEPHARDEALIRSRDLWNQYVYCGSYVALLKDIEASPYAPEMEFTAKGNIEGVPLLGKPDLRYVTKGGVQVISDWKVNGSTSRIGASPTQGYKICRDYGSKTDGQPFRARRLKKDPPDKVYKDYTPTSFKDVEINSFNLEEYSPDWATQLAIYSWLLKEPIGSEEFVIRMEQAACRPVKTRDLPRVKFATHMSKIGRHYQESVLARVKMCWATIESGHIFTDMTREESDEMCERLIAKAQIPVGLFPILDKYAGTSVRTRTR